MIKKQQKALFTSILISFPSPFFTGAAYLLSQSTTQLADFFRRTAELGAIIIAWIVYKKIHKNEEIVKDKQTRLEKIANIGIVCSMIFSGIIMIILSTLQFNNYEIRGNVGLGIIVTSVTLLTNTILYIRYANFNRKEYNSVIAGHVTLYLSKALVDICVLIVLFTIWIIPRHSLTRYIDTVGSIIVAIYLIFKGIRIYHHQDEAIV